MSVRVDKTGRDFEKLKFASPSFTLSNRSGRCVCVTMPGFIHLLKPGLMGAKLLWLYQQIRDLGLHLFGSDITVSFFQCTAQKTKEEGEGG